MRQIDKDEADKLEIIFGIERAQASQKIIDLSAKHEYAIT